MSEIDSQYVKLGRWTNLEAGPIMGQTLTTDSRTGTALVAILALFASMGINHLFHLTAFVYHQIRADGQPHSGLFHQQQALLSTLPTPGTLLTDSIKLWYFWRRTFDQALRHSIGMTLFSGLFGIGSIAASVFSSFVVTNGNIQVLVNSPHCAYINRTALMGIDNYTIPMLYLSTVNSPAFTYMGDCYNKSGSLPSRCQSFTRPQIDFSVNIAPCPYGNLCSSPAIVFDSGLFDVGKAFGLNTPSEDRVKYRKRDSCAILSQEGRVWSVNSSDLPEEYTGRPALPNEEHLLYSYGKQRDNNKWANVTFLTSLFSSNATSLYRTRHIFRAGTAKNDHYLPPPEMERDDADLIVRFIEKNSATYVTPIDDRIFAAHKMLTRFSTNYNDTQPSYMSDSHGTVVGCIEQYQYCIVNASSHDVCSSLRGIMTSVENSTYPNATPVQRRLLQNLMILGDMFSIKSIPRLLVAQILESNGFIYRLPEDQWIKELYAWEATVWAAHQIGLTDMAIGPSLRDPWADSYTHRPMTEAERQLCSMQRMRKSGGFVNINLFGCIFILVVSITVTLLDIFVLRFLIYLGRFRKSLSPRIDRWLQNGVYQLQRRAYEAQGLGIWTRLNHEIPVTVGNTALFDLILEDNQRIQRKDSGSPMRSFIAIEKRISDFDDGLSDNAASNLCSE